MSIMKEICEMKDEVIELRGDQLNRFRIALRSIGFSPEEDSEVLYGVLDKNTNARDWYNIDPRKTTENAQIS